VVTSRPYFITNAERECRPSFEDLHILIYEKKLSALQELLPLLEAAAQRWQNRSSSSPRMWRAKPLATLVVNKLRGGLKVAAVKAPGFGDRRKAILQDIAILTGGTVVSEDLGVQARACDAQHARPCQEGVDREGRAPRSSAAPARRPTLRLGLPRSGCKSRRPHLTTIVRSSRSGSPSSPGGGSR